MTREFIDEQASKNLTPEVEGVIIIGSFSLNRIKKSEKGDLEKKSKNVGFLTQFRNQKYFLATNDHKEFAVFNLEEGKGISELKESSFDLNFQELVGVEQIGDDELVLVSSEGFAKTLTLKGGQWLKQDNQYLHNKSFLTLILKEGEKKKGIKASLIEKLAKIEYDFDQFLLRNENIFGDFSSNTILLSQVRGDRRYKKPISWRLKALSSLVKAKKIDTSRLKEERNRLESLRFFFKCLRELKKRYVYKNEATTTQTSYNYRERIDLLKVEFRDKETRTVPHTTGDDHNRERIKDQRWDPLTSKIFKEYSDLGLKLEKPESTKEERFQRLLMLKFDLEIMCFKNLCIRADKKISCIASFCFKIPKKSSSSSELVSHEERRLKKDSKLDHTLNANPEDSGKKSGGSGLGGTENEDLGQQDRRSRSQKSHKEKESDSHISYHVLVCAQGGSCFDEGHELVFYLKEKFSNKFQKAQVLKIQKLLNDAKKLKKTEKHLRRKNKSTNLSKKRGKTYAEDLDLPPTANPNFSQDQTTIPSLTESREDRQKLGKISCQKIERITISQPCISQSKIDVNKILKHKYQMRLLVNLKDKGRRHIFKREINFGFEIHTRSKLSELENIFSCNIDYSSVKVVDK